jgi:hypothetical protein
MPVTINGSTGLTSNNGSVFTDASGNVSAVGRYQFGANAANPSDATAAFYDQALAGPTISGFAVTFRTGASPAERMRINNNGLITAPFQAGFSAVRTSSVVIGGAFTTIGNLTPYFNTGSYLNATTGIFTAPVAGNYLFSFSYRGNDGSADPDSVSGRILRNSTMYFLDIWGSPGRTQDGTFRNFVTGSVVMNMAAGDTAAFQANGTFLQGNFSGYLLG